MSSVCPDLPQTEVPGFAQFFSPSTNSLLMPPLIPVLQPPFCPPGALYKPLVMSNFTSCLWCLCLPQSCTDALLWKPQVPLLQRNSTNLWEWMRDIAKTSLLLWERPLELECKILIDSSCTASGMRWYGNIHKNTAHKNTPSFFFPLHLQKA